MWDMIAQNATKIGVSEASVLGLGHTPGLAQPLAHPALEDDMNAALHVPLPSQPNGLLVHDTNTGDECLVQTDSPTELWKQGHAWALEIARMRSKPSAAGGKKVVARSGGGAEGKSSEHEECVATDKEPRQFDRKIYAKQEMLQMKSCQHTDMMTALLRQAWHAPTEERACVECVCMQPQFNVELTQSAADACGPISFWDMITGKVASRVPQLNGQMRWDALCCGLVLYVTLTLPPQVAFTEEHSIGLMRFIDIIVDILFVLDIYINTRTGFFLRDEETGIWSLQLGPWACTKRYLLSWAAIDVISVVPFDLMFVTASSAAVVNKRILRLPRCLKLLRLPRLFRYVHKWQELLPISSIMMQLIKCILVMLLFAHIIACLLILAATLEGFPEESWMVVYGVISLSAAAAKESLVCGSWSLPLLGVFIRVLRRSEQYQFVLKATFSFADLVQASKLQQYIYALFISTSHLFCLGYGLSSIPGTFAELCTTLVSMTVGSVLFLVVVGTLPTAVLEQEVSAAAQELDGAYHAPLPVARHPHGRARLTNYIEVLAARASIAHLKTDIKEHAKTESNTCLRGGVPESDSQGSQDALSHRNEPSKLKQPIQPDRNEGYT